MARRSAVGARPVPEAVAVTERSSARWQSARDELQTALQLVEGRVAAGTNA